ncbi:MAG TPA: DUF2844 domain-containing protein [Burkholderiaceae bacterium]|jgi:hypothetical protein
MKLRKSLLSLALLVLALSPSAHAALGEPASSLQGDRMQMKAATPLSTSKLNYTVHEMTTSNGIVVREYVSGGIVFAVSWHGPRMPDLKQLMGSYFETYKTEAAVKHSGHSHLAIRRDDLVVGASGHMRDFSGFAYVPRMLPSGVNERDLQ